MFYAHCLGLWVVFAGVENLEAVFVYMKYLLDPCVFNRHSMHCYNCQEMNNREAHIWKASFLPARIFLEVTIIFHSSHIEDSTFDDVGSR